MSSVNEELFQSKLNKITKRSINRYMDFWDYNNFVFVSDCDLAKRIKCIYKELNKSTGGICNPLRIVDNWGVTYERSIITVNQLIYDLEVFETIPEEIMPRIKKSIFKDFVTERFSDLRQDGWDLLVSNPNQFFNSDEDADSLFRFLELGISPLTNKCILINCGDEASVNGYYDVLRDKYRIERHRFLALFREWIMQEIFFYFRREFEKYGVSVILVNWRWAWNNYLYPAVSISSSDIEKRSEFSVYNICGNEKNYSDFLSELYGDDYSEEYVRGVMDIPLLNEYSVGSIHHADKSSKYLNVFCGERRTTDRINEAENSIYLLGGCVFFGYAIDDANTVASFLQRRINNSELNGKYNVNNYGTWGGNIDQTWHTFFELEYKKGDIIIISYAGMVPLGDEPDKNDVSDKLCECSGDRFYYDRVMHCNALGYQKVSERLFEIINDESNKNRESDSHPFRLIRNKDYESDRTTYSAEADKWLNTVIESLPQLKRDGKEYGACVMNCNPFTLGHRYLIEKASSMVDYLFVFVVEEDKSFFPFKDRIDLVRKGTADLKNVFVVPSGNLMISAVTFPGYFFKDNPEFSDVDSSMDVEVFGRYIAPRLGITKRFVGEEPKDLVTRRYNETMKKILPRFGMELIEIPRKEVVTESEVSVISASTVRELMKLGRMDEVKRFVPKTTFEYLVRNR